MQMGKNMMRNILLILVLCLVVKTWATTIPPNSIVEKELAELKTLVTALKSEIQGNKELETKLSTCKTDLISVQGQLQKCMATPKFPRTCGDWKRAGFRGNGDYVVDPDGAGGVPQFHVECDMTLHFNQTITILHHNSEARLKATRCSSSVPKCSIRQVAYHASLAQITRVINLSSKCVQFIKYECLHNPIVYKTSRWASLYSRSGKELDYWGGATPGSNKCACGMSNSCDTPGKACNCDTEDGTWRSDSGLLGFKDDLPITKMAFGDLNHDLEDGYHRLGPLQCYD